MYAKILIPGLPPLPCLLATASDYDVLADQLRRRGWGVLGGPSPRESAGQLTVGLRGVTLTVEGQALLADDANPAGPAGWWPAVDAFGGRCCVQVVPAGELDLHADDLGDRLADLMATGRGVVGIVPVATDLGH